MLIPDFDSTKSRVCKACGLYLNQLPVFDEQKTSSVFWVGLSSVLMGINDVRLPLAPSTRTGSLIERIENDYKQELSFYKTNIVKCLPLENEKIRYPKKHEMQKCYPNLVEEIEHLRPTLVFLLGKQVATFILEQHSTKIVSLSNSFDYTSFQIGKVTYIPIHHPSFILVYKRKNIEDYIRGVDAFLQQITTLQCV
jgi:DNA polymerase